MTNSSAPEARNMYYLVTLGSLGSLGILLNGLLLFALWRNKTSEFRNGTSFIIGNLALADSFTGLAVILFVIGDARVERFQLSMVWTTIQASLLSLMVLSIERIIAFAYPFKTQIIVTMQRTLITLVCVWIISVSCGIFVRFFKVPSQFVLTVIYEATVFVFTVSHGIIFLKMQRRNKQMHVLNRNISRDTRKAMHQLANNHVTKVVLILIFILVVTVLPYMIALQLIFWDILKLQPPINKSTIDGAVQFAYYFYPIELLNFIVNPVIYAWRLKRYRRAFYEALSPLNCICCGIKQAGLRNLNSSAIYTRESCARYGKSGDTVLLSKRTSSKILNRKSSIGCESDEV